MRIDFATRRSSSGASVSLPGKLFGCFFFGLFFAAGLFFAVMLVGAVLAELQTYLWSATPCEIVASSIETASDGAAGYRPAIRYRYTYDGVDHESDKVSHRDASSDDYADAAELVAAYPVGASATCYVNSSEPRQAVLERTIPWFGLFIALPLIFIAVGGGGIWITWRAPDRSGTEDQKPRALSRRAGADGKAFWALLIFGGIFAAVGGGSFLFMAVIPMTHLWAAQSWLEVPCTVISSEVQSHTGDDSTTYSIDILYEYKVEPPGGGSVTLRSNRYDFMGWSSSGYDSKREVVDEYPPGSRAICFVNPERPARAVLDRSFQLEYLVGLFPLIFLVVGLGIMRWAFVLRRTRLLAPSPGLTPVPSPRLSAGSGISGMPEAVVSATGSLELKPTHSPAVKLVGAIAFSLFWNGIVSVFLWQVISDFADGGGSWFMVLFLTPFVLVGLGAISMIGYYALAMANPRPHLVMTPPAPRLGETVSLTWRLRGATGRLRRLEIKLEGREEATYRRGTTTHTDKETFANLCLVDTGMAPEIAAGSARITIPPDTMHSFSGSNNKIIWAIKVKGDIPRWPDVSDDYVVVVRPAAPEERYGR